MGPRAEGAARKTADHHYNWAPRWVARPQRLRAGIGGDIGQEGAARLRGIHDTFGNCKEKEPLLKSLFGRKNAARGVVPIVVVVIGVLAADKIPLFGDPLVSAVRLVRPCDKPKGAIGERERKRGANQKPNNTNGPLTRGRVTAGGEDGRGEKGAGEQSEENVER